MVISIQDAERLLSVLWHKEEQINKKRRWLMQLPLRGTNEVDLKKFKKLRFLAESFVKRDEVSCQAIKIDIERNHRVLCYTEERLHVLSAPKYEALISTLGQLNEILIKHENYKENEPSLMIPTWSSTLPSIYKALELLGSMPIFALCALSRKLNGNKLVHRFPPSKIGYNKKELLKRIRKRCGKLIQTIKKKNLMLEKLAKAMAVIYLYFEYKTKCCSTFTTKFFSFSTETVIHLNDILNALWSIPKVTSYQIKGLQAIMGVKSKDDSTSFLNELKHYLMQFLLECGEIEIPSDVHNVVAILNQPKTCLETIEVETETVLNVSTELNQIVSHLLSSSCTYVKAAESLESEDKNANSNDFELVENGYCSNTIKYQNQQKNDFSNIDDLESTGDSMPGSYFISSTSEIPKSIDHDFVKKLKKEPDDVDDLIVPHDKESLETFLLNTQESENHRDISIQELCDETSLVSHRLIGNMLNSFLLAKGRVLGVANLTGEALHPSTSQDKRDLLDSSGENVGIKALMHSIKDLLPSIPERCIERVEKLMKQP